MSEIQEWTQPVTIDDSMSSEIGKLAEALAKAQAEMGAASKDATNPFFKSTYATLDSVITACKPMHNNGLSYTQMPGNDGEMVTVTTLLMHSSGQWIRSTVGVRPSKADAQGYGSVISYLRRYALASVSGTASSDDDANAASGKTEKAEKKLIEPDPDALASLQECDSLESLQEHWKSLTNNQRVSIGKERLDAMKKSLA